MKGVSFFTGVMDVFAELCKVHIKSIGQHESNPPKWVTMKGYTSAAPLFLDLSLHGRSFRSRRLRVGIGHIVTNA